MSQNPAKKPAYGTEAYRKTNVITANKETILLMMYAGAIRFLKRAIDAAEKGSIEEKVTNIKKTQDIVTELRATLNHEVGGELATSLDSLYSFILERLLQATLEKKNEYLHEALGILNTLNLAWEEAVSNLKKEKAIINQNTK